MVKVVKLTALPEPFGEAFFFLYLISHHQGKENKRKKIDETIHQVSEEINLI